MENRIRTKEISEVWSASLISFDLFLLLQYSEHIARIDDREPAFVIQPFQLAHWAAQLAGDAPEAIALLYGVGGVPQIFRHIRCHAILSKV